MISAEAYRKENKKLMAEYEDAVRLWLSSKGKGDIAEVIPFFRDGVVNPEKWFQKGNDFRPMIILKEVSLGINTRGELPDYLSTWGNPKYFEFVENPFDDVRIGTFSQWQRIVRLIKGLEEIHMGEDWCDYYKYNFSFIPGGENYSGHITGYNTINKQRTANSLYLDTIDKMALLEIKKIGGGQTVNSKLSLLTEHYTQHIAPFSNWLCRQIELIDPTVIICCGREYGNCISELLKEVKRNTGDRLWIDGYHHTRSSNLKFYENPLITYKERIR